MEQKIETTKEFIKLLNEAMGTTEIQTGEDFEKAVFNHAKAIDNTLIADLNPTIDAHAGFRIRNEHLPADCRVIKDMNRVIVSYFEIENKDDVRKLAAIYASAYPDLEAIVSDMRGHVGDHKNKIYPALSFSARFFVRDVLPNLKAGLIPEVKQKVEFEAITVVDTYRNNTSAPTKNSDNKNSFYKPAPAGSSAPAAAKVEEKTSTCIFQ